MKYEYKDIEISYINYGNKKGEDLILLHGWGQNIEMMKPLGDNLSNNHNIYILDLPGQGNSQEPSYAWNLIDYVDMLNNFIRDKKIKNPILIGHSFGGEISLLYASIYETKKLVVLDSPFRPIKKIGLKTKLLKLAKKIPVLNKFEDFAKKHIGSQEYRVASPIMRAILVNSVNTDLTKDLASITAPTLIIWGVQDDTVPIEDGYALEKLINDAGIVAYEGCTHYAYLERLGQTTSVLNSFIGG